ncbi:hypothetical protein C8A00DRAFT_38173 [Chaetomidium leptoderma]|uniref:Uncharacterized protein n=1 Tax=Chaetomidium leptoderma TaxID=669021 RepID=A0AAN6VFJ1_9PEZI|nr:hypothetical protein C8A00DRAFT_38173 [Chaetomidium leptoderma]
MFSSRGVPTAAKLRTVLVKVSPAPTTLSERRAILRVLKQHGEVEVFKKLHDPSHFISVVANPQIAAGLVERSPLQFDFAAQRGRGGAATDSATSANKTFLVKIVEKSDYKHKTHIRESPLYGRWPQPQHNNSLFQEDSVAKAALRRACPQGMDWYGLVDWESCGQADVDGGLATRLNSKTDYVQSRRTRQNSKGKFESLMEAYEAKHGKREGREGGEGKPDVGGGA